MFKSCSELFDSITARIVFPEDEHKTEQLFWEEFEKKFSGLRSVASIVAVTQLRALIKKHGLMIQAVWP